MEQLINTLDCNNMNRSSCCCEWSGYERKEWSRRKQSREATGNSYQPWKCLLCRPLACFLLLIKLRRHDRVLCWIKRHSSEALQVSGVYPAKTVCNELIDADGTWLHCKVETPIGGTNGPLKIPYHYRWSMECIWPFCLTKLNQVKITILMME